MALDSWIDFLNQEWEQGFLPTQSKEE